MPTNRRSPPERPHRPRQLDIRRDHPDRRCPQQMAPRQHDGRAAMAGQSHSEVVRAELRVVPVPPAAQRREDLGRLREIRTLDPLHVEHQPRPDKRAGQCPWRHSIADHMDVSGSTDSAARPLQHDTASRRRPGNQRDEFDHVKPRDQPGSSLRQPLSDHRRYAPARFAHRRPGLRHCRAAVRTTRRTAPPRWHPADAPWPSGRRSD